MDNLCVYERVDEQADILEYLLLTLALEERRRWGRPLRPLDRRAGRLPAGSINSPVQPPPLCRCTASKQRRKGSIDGR